ncbi:MAG: hypothetical protein LAT55_11135 [Opitutales bacterium]|nr:hypothetical protein [Opitutales bacterium]
MISISQTTGQPEIALRGAMQAILRQGESFLQNLSGETYTQACPEAFGATMGAHYRHCLEHFEAIVEPAGEGLVDYDARKRDRLVETDRDEALRRTQLLREKISALGEEDLSREVKVRCRVSEREEENPLVASSLAREGMYGVIHAVHHFALIKVMAGLRKIPVPEDFGMAPSTAHYRRQQAGAE